ncbi:hypothetical protein PFICI_03243 [Pestalotiopsis fici W106-1]|uniref:BTB domain-containing protein n=1 Tax=Pestalotiopsis fici (strain W106-1 / CGMCC3.15140) TaxID=1229662 RepID=W3XGL6_PESFW|nr:uncharacterized protein PFICI_03243 [Pestalotiopsis fici W106-1]ETS85218.1 hypothetical protein PFICI_03243 [Pestalotiopsis fici W106-1]
MAAYDQYGMLFKSEIFSDFKLTCNGTTIPVHRIVLATHSPVFRRAMTSSFKEAREGLMNLPEDDPVILEKFLSIMYRGTYDDALFGKAQAPHLTTTLPLKKLIGFLSGTEAGWDLDMNERKALDNFHCTNDIDSPEGMALAQESLQDALYIYFMAKKYQCAIAAVIAHDRFLSALDFCFDKPEFSDQELHKFIEVIDELYSNSIPKDILRLTLCRHFHRFTDKRPDVGQRFGALATDLIKAHPEFATDMNSTRYSY